jgi:hypothetical protein
MSRLSGIPSSCCSNNDDDNTSPSTTTSSSRLGSTVTLSSPLFPSLQSPRPSSSPPAEVGRTPGQQLHHRTWPRHYRRRYGRIDGRFTTNRGGANFLSSSTAAAVFTTATTHGRHNNSNNNNNDSRRTRNLRLQPSTAVFRSEEIHQEDEDKLIKTTVMTTVQIIEAALCIVNTIDFEKGNNTQRTGEADA